MSREERYKGHDLLLEIWKEVRSRHPGAELLVAGEGDDRPRLEAKAKQLGLEGSVRFLGKVPSEELESIYRGCAFFVMPSRREGFGFVFLEAMRAGKACIGARGAAGEIVEDGVTGYVVDPDERGAVISAIGKLWKDPVARERMGTLGRKRFLAHFTRERFEKRLRQLIEPH
jgi:phosphatidylinositol alpha-1,6-mannosyltransferase